MRNELIETVAKALCEAEEVEPDKNDFSCGIDTNWHVFEDMAKTALDTLRANGVLNEGWQPIETAPKDGTEILTVRLLENGACFDPYITIWCTPRRRTFNNYVVNDGKPAWLSQDQEWLVPIPTHWMPLPTPPKE